MGDCNNITFIAIIQIYDHTKQCIYFLCDQKLHGHFPEKAALQPLLWIQDENPFSPRPWPNGAFFSLLQWKVLNGPKYRL